MQTFYTFALNGTLHFFPADLKWSDGQTEYKSKVNENETNINEMKY